MKTKLELIQKLQEVKTLCLYRSEVLRLLPNSPEGALALDKALDERQSQNSFVVSLNPDDGKIGILLGFTDTENKAMWDHVAQQYSLKEAETIFANCNTGS